MSYSFILLSFIQVCLSSPARDLAGVLLSLRSNHRPNNTPNIPSSIPCTPSASHTPCTSDTNCTSQNARSSFILQTSQDIQITSKNSNPASILPDSQNGFKSQADDDDRKGSAKNGCVLKSDQLTAIKRESIVSKTEEVTLRKEEDELTIRYWKALQACLAHAGVNLQVWSKLQIVARRHKWEKFCIQDSDGTLLFQSDLCYPLEALREDLVPALKMTELLFFDNELWWGLWMEMITAVSTLYRA